MLELRFANPAQAVFAAPLRTYRSRSCSLSRPRSRRLLNRFHKRPYANLFLCILTDVPLPCKRSGCSVVGSFEIFGVFPLKRRLFRRAEKLLSQHPLQHAFHACKGQKLPLP